MSNTVVVGILGWDLDSGMTQKRWKKWRPTVAMCQHEDLLVTRLDLMRGQAQEELAALVRADIAAVSPETEVCEHIVDFEDPWDFVEVYGRLHDFARNYEFSPQTEDYLVHITTGTHVAQISLFLLTEQRYFPACLLQTAPARRRRADGEGEYRIIDLDLARYDQLAARFERVQQDGLSYLKSGIPTRNAGFNQLMEQIERVAVHSEAPLLLTGPTGAGKTQLARRLYELKRKRGLIGGRFVEINCATLRGDQAMSTLFGHRRGAFTGATEDRPGLLVAADNGLLFLDEVGELPLDEQAMLLRAIEDKRFLPVGGDREVSSNFLLVAGTNRDLASDVDAGRFREDLLARLNLWTFRLPGLADRREDIEPNLDYEIARYESQTGKHVSFNRAARKRFLEFAASDAASWRGNFRDLNAAVTRMATLAQGGRVTEQQVDDETRRLHASWRTELTGGEVNIELVLGPEAAEQLDPFDRVQLEHVLGVCLASESLSAAGRRLFAVSRLEKKRQNDADRLRKYLAKFGVQWSDLKERRRDLR